MRVAEIIRLSLRTLGVLAAEETPSAAEEFDALTTLNDLLDSWVGERLLSLTTVRTSYVLTSGLSPHTLGVGGSLNSTRPVRIDRASIVPGGSATSELSLSLLSDAEWQATQGKTTPGTPAGLWVESAYPLMRLHFNPVPNAADTLVLYTWQLPGHFLNAAALFDVSPGHARAIRYNLAKELAPEYGLSLSAEAADIANESKSTLKRLNSKPSYLRCDDAVLQGGFNLVSGDG